MDFKVQLKKYQEQVNNELEKYSGKKDVPEKILNNSMEYSLMAGGKRLRPILVIATYEIFGKNINKCIPYAVAIEMVHNFSLIHDDLPGIDNDDFRHGKPTNHKKFNEATAILAGDGLLNQAYIVISEDLIKSESEELKNYVYNEVQTRLGEVSCGNLFFAEGTDNSVEGTYIFNKNNEYHILFTEKGKIRSDIVTDKKREVLWNAVNIISANIIINFAICNREKGKDFRRALFAKEKEIFSLFGQDFQKRKDEEIEEILKKNPYNDI